MTKQSRAERIAELVLAPGSCVKPSIINPGYVVVVDGRTGLDACERGADAAFDALFGEADGGMSPGRIGADFGMFAPPTGVTKDG